MIIEEEKVEIVDAPEVETKEQEVIFEQVKEDEKNSKKTYVIPLGVFILIFLCLIIIIFGVFTFFNYRNNNKIANGIYIDKIEVASLSKEQAIQKLQEYYNDKISNDITVVYNNYTTYIKPAEIDLQVDVASSVNYAFNIGKTGNIFNDNYQIFSAMINGVNITPTANFNEEKLKEILNKLSAELPDAVVESGYYQEGNKLIITKGKEGLVIDTDLTIQEFKNKIANLSYLNEVIELKTKNQSPKAINLDEVYNSVHKEPKDAYYTTNPFAVYPSENGTDFAVSISEAQNIIDSAENECEIPLKVLKPSVTTNMIGQEAFPDLLGSFSTKYAASNVNRTTNLRLASNKINGHVLMPGETFSYNQVVGARTIAAGYKEAAVYENGEVVQGLGGGICQISTTLYNACLFANLEMVELHNHQFVPSYVSAGRDATVVYGVKDYKFKNSRKHAIKITCSVAGGTATFQIWGVKEETEYDVSVYANVNSRTSSYIKSSTYRTLKLNGKTVKTENVINSTYKVH